MRYSFTRKNRSLPLYADSIGIHWPQETIHRQQGYPYVHWLHTQSGSGAIKIEGKTILLPPGSGILINQNIPHQYEATGEWTTAYFTFGGALVSEILTLLGIQKFLVITDSAFDFDHYLEELASTLEHTDVASDLFASEMIYSFLMRIKECLLTEQNKQSQHLAIIQPVVDYIEEHYDEPLSNKQLAQLIGYSPQYMTRLFNLVLHTSPNQYLIEHRIRKAKELLANQPLLSIKEISDLVGFSDTSYFIAMFKRTEKVTPKTFKQYYHKSE